MTLHPIPMNFLIYEENCIFFFISVGWRREVSSLKFLMACGCVELLYRQGVETDIGYISLQIYFIIKSGYL
jgi:hypothetical protein